MYVYVCVCICMYIYSYVYTCTGSALTQKAPILRANDLYAACTNIRTHTLTCICVFI